MPTVACTKTREAHVSMLGRRALLCIVGAGLALVAVHTAGAPRTELADRTNLSLPFINGPRKAHPRRGAFTKQQKLIKWAEAHGMPTSLAKNPADKAKVKSIIARMKADLVVERLQSQMKKDSSSVSDIMHMSDPSAAGV
jgi:hypothetical protein